MNKETYEALAEALNDIVEAILKGARRKSLLIMAERATKALDEYYAEAITIANQKAGGKDNDKP